MAVGACPDAKICLGAVRASPNPHISEIASSFRTFPAGKFPAGNEVVFDNYVNSLDYIQVTD